MLRPWVDETYLAKTRVMGLPYGKNFIILTSTGFCRIRPCDGQTDGRAIAYSALSIYAVQMRAKNENENGLTISIWIEVITYL